MEVSWLPEDQRTTAYYLFHNLFLCRVPNIQTMSSEYIRLHGMPSTGDPALDKHAAGEMVMRMITINRMMELVTSGARIEVVNKDDTKSIYEYITNHLTAWKTELRYTMGHPNPKVVRDLIEMDNFANLVYEHAKYHFSPDAIDSDLARKLDGMLSFSKATVLAKLGAIAPVIDEKGEEVDKYPARQSFASVFAERKTIRR